MFLKCQLINKPCGYCGQYKGVKYCGASKPKRKETFTNQISKMSKCPLTTNLVDISIC